MPAPAVNTRSTRSRYSSPQQPAKADADSRAAGSGSSGRNAADSQRSFMQRWLEPPVQVRASYQDAGLVRAGVLETMAPLGTLPKAGIFKKTAPPQTPTPETRHSTKIVLKRPQTTVVTPTPAPPPPPPPTPPAPQVREEDETEEEEADQDADMNDAEDEREPEDEGDYDDDEDDDQGPITPRVSSAAARRRPLPTRDQDWSPINKASQKGQSRRSMPRSGSQTSQPARPSSSATPFSSAAEQKEFVDKIVEMAVDEALAHFRYPTAWALRTFYDENSTKPEIVTMVEKVFRQTADRDTLLEFGRIISAKKKEGKKDNKACYYFIPPSTNNRFTPHKPKRAPYAGALTRTSLDLLRGTRPSTAQTQRSSEERQVRESEPSTEIATEPASEAEPELKQEQESGAEREAEAETETERATELEPELELERGPGAEPEAEAKSVPELAEPAAEPQQEPRVPAKRKVDAEPDIPPAEPEAEPEPEQRPTRKKRRSGRHPGATTIKMTPNGVSKKAAGDSPSKRRTRVRSVSSTSSLSSVRSMTPPEGVRPDEEEDEGDVYEVPQSRNSPAPSQQPIGRRRRQPNPVRKSVSGNMSSTRRSPAVTPAATSRQVEQASAAQPAVEEQPYDMPAEVESPFFLTQNLKKGKANSVSFPSRVGRIDESDVKLQLRLSARRVTAAENKPATESYSRARADEAGDEAMQQQHEQQEAEDRAASIPPAAVSASRTRTSLPASRPTPAPGGREGRTRSSRKRSHDELDEQPSPTVAAFAASEVASTAANSRAGTPALRPAKKQRTGLRVKTSPVKKRNGTAAGIPRGGERSSPMANSNLLREDDNDDFCSSCGGNGNLICCDGCTRVFHELCVDPPLREDPMSLPDWFCNVCRVDNAAVAGAGSGPLADANPGAFGLLFDRLDVRNGSAFSLPDPVKNYFDGVRTGPDGEYEEAVAPVKPGGKKKKSDEDQVSDPFRLRDAKGAPAICHGCQKSSSTNRAIVACSIAGCHMVWHLDCLDPPLANPPIAHTWKCPLHVEDLLAHLPGALGPAHRHRKIKGAPVIQPAYSRGYVNNGFIEIEPESEDESGWKDVETFGRTVRLPEKGIKLDFLSRARENRKGKPIPPLNVPAPATAPAPTPVVLDQATIDAHQAAHSLAKLSGQGPAGGLNLLVDALVAEADPTLISVMARADPSHVEAGTLGRMDQQGLRAMLAQVELVTQQIRHLLGTTTPSPASKADGATGPVPSLTNSQSVDGDSEHVANSIYVDADAVKSLASPADTDDVPPMVQGSDKASIQNGQSPRARSEENTADEEGDLPATPTKTTGAADGPMVVKPAVEDEMDLD